MRNDSLIIRLIVVFILLQPLSFAAGSGTDKTVPFDPENPLIIKAGQDVANQMLKRKLPFLSLSYSDPDDDEDEDGFILSYDWQKLWQNFEYAKGDAKTDAAAENYDASLFAKGSHGLGDADNPTNKSEFGFALSYHRAAYGKLATVVVKGTEAEVAGCMANISEDLAVDKYDEKVDECAEKFGVVQMFADNHLNQFQTVYGIDVHAKVEGDENFSQKHFVYGLQLIGSMNPPASDLLSRLNILDWPFILTRKAIGGSKGFNPDWPIIRIGLQSVEVEANDAREAAAPGEDSFARMFGEIAFTTNVCEISGKTIKFNTGYEYYKEIDADERISAADLDEFGFFSASFQIPVSLVTDKVSDRNMFFIRYTNGKLPFDRKSSKAFDLGWQTNFNLEGLFSDPD